MRGFILICVSQSLTESIRNPKVFLSLTPFRLSRFILITRFNISFFLNFSHQIKTFFYSILNKHLDSYSRQMFSSEIRSAPGRRENTLLSEDLGRTMSWPLTLTRVTI